MPRLSPPAGRSLVEQFCALATVRTGPHFAKFRRACLLETVAALALCLTGTEALAACNLLGETVTCSGFTTGSPVVIAPPPPSVTINILSGATVNGGLDIGVFETVTVNNSGQIVNGPLNIDVTGPGDSVFENNGGISGTATIDHTLGSTFTFHQSSGQPVGTLNMTGTGDNSLAVNAGASITNIAMTGGTNYVDNSGTTANQNLVMTATVQNYVVNRPGAQVNTNLLVAPENVVENFGRFNSGITFDDGVGPAIDNANNTVVNYQGAPSRRRATAKRTPRITSRTPVSSTASSNSATATTTS